MYLVQTDHFHLRPVLSFILPHGEIQVQCLYPQTIGVESQLVGAALPYIYGRVFVLVIVLARLLANKPG